MFAPTISKDDLKLLPTGQFQGTIHVINDAHTADFMCDRLIHEPLIGFDTETRPSFTKGKVNRVALLQLTSGTDAYLFRLQKTGLPEKLIGILSNEKILKVGAAIRDDIRHLKKIRHFEEGGFIELQEFVRDFGIINSGLSKLAGIVLNFRISKSQQLSNWESEVLSEAQQLYAATDAWVAREIYSTLINRQLLDK